MISPISQLSDLLFEHLRDLHSVEIHLCRALPILAGLATVPELQDLLAKHAVSTLRQKCELRAILEKHGEKLGSEVSQSIGALIDGGKRHLAMVIDPTVRDFMVISLFARIKYYEVAAYSFTTAFAQGLGYYREAEVVAAICEKEREMIHYLNSAAANLLVMKRTAAAQ